MVKISIDDYQFYIAPLIDACEKKNCREYWNIIRGQKVAKGSKRLEILTLFNKIVSYALTPDSRNQPFKPILIMNGQSSIPDDLTPEERDFLQQVLPEIKDNELKARVADTLWTLKHGKAKEHAKIAIEAYLVFDKTQLEERWIYINSRLARALRIFDNLRLFNDNKCPPKINAPKKISEYIESSTTPPHLVWHLIELLHATNHPYNDKHAKILESIATNYESEPNYHVAKHVWDLAASLYKRAKNTNDAIRCQVNAAETYVSLADDKEKAQPPSYLHVKGFLESAVEAYNAIPSKKERRVELCKRLLDAKSKAQNEMHDIHFEIKVPSNEIKPYEDQVSGLDLYNALYNFAFIEEPPRLEEMNKKLEVSEQKTPLNSFVPIQYTDDKGRIVGNPSIHDSPESKMHRYIAPSIRVSKVLGAFIPALEQIRLEHNASLFYWKCLIKDHAFIPPERVNIYALGLYHGFHGDFFSAAHILIPQIENSICYLLNNHGKQTLRQLQDGTQEERSLNQTLKSDELEKIFRKDLIFDLQGLLIKKEGTNLRNRLMHGFVDDKQLLFSPDLVYLYWLTLHIIFIPFRGAQEPNPNPQ